MFQKLFLQFKNIYNLIHLDYMYAGILDIKID